MNKIETSLSTQHGDFRIICYPNSGGEPDFVLIRGDVANKTSVLTRIQSECLTGHVLQSLSCDCYEQLQDALKLLTCAPEGILIYLRQEGRGIGLAAKLSSYILQKQGLDTVDANLKLGFDIDKRTYDAAATILNDLGVGSIRLITNNPQKVDGLQTAGIQVIERVPLPPTVRDQNRRYLKTKVERMGHIFDVN